MIPHFNNIAALLHNFLGKPSRAKHYGIDCSTIRYVASNPHINLRLTLHDTSTLDHNVRKWRAQVLKENV